MNLIWVSVEDGFPIIPEKHYGVSVLVVTNDPVYYECCPNHKHKGQFVGDASYGYVNYEKMPMFEGSIYKNGEPAFMELYTHGSGKNTWGPTGDKVTHWMHYPDPPK